MSDQSLRYTYDNKKTVAYFSNNPLINDVKQEITVVCADTDTGLFAMVKPHFIKGGYSLEEFHRKVMALKELHDTNEDEGFVLSFTVHTSAFSSYLKARELINALEIPAGWQTMPTEISYFRYRVRIGTCNRLRQQSSGGGVRARKGPSSGAN